LRRWHGCRRWHRLAACDQAAHNTYKKRGPPSHALLFHHDFLKLLNIV